MKRFFIFLGTLAAVLAAVLVLLEWLGDPAEVWVRKNGGAE